MNHFGGAILEIPSLSWDYSGYYEDELGAPVRRTFLFFNDKTIPETLADIKLLTNDIERQLAQGGKRSINLDPGYITLSKVVLASTKNYSHRIYIGKGIHAEVTLIYRDGKYRPHIFTYPDFASEAYNEIFEEARGVLRRLIADTERKR